MLSWSELRYGIVLGRMQPLHVGHVEYLEAARARCDRVVIGVTSPYVDDLVDDAADIRRSKPENNPFSYIDRVEMISTSMIELGWHPDDFLIVPADINRPHLLHNVLPSPLTATVFTTIYDEWGDRKSDLMEELGYSVEVLWRRRMDERITSGTALRMAMRNDCEWRHMVPGAVARYLDESGAMAAIRDNRTSRVQQ